MKRVINFNKINWKGICKYGNNCTFAHGETELRSKVENSILMQNGPTQNQPGNQFMPFGQFYDPNMLCWMQPPFLPMNTGNLLGNIMI